MYAWLMSRTDGDPEARDQLDAQIYAPAQGLEKANANLWAAIQQAED